MQIISLFFGVVILTLLSWIVAFVNYLFIGLAIGIGLAIVVLIMGV